MGKKRHWLLTPLKVELEVKPLSSRGVLALMLYAAAASGLPRWADCGVCVVVLEMAGG